MTQHLMIDLETLGAGDHAAIVQIGVAEFTKAGVGQAAVWNILARCENFGEVEPDTVKWWQEQDPDARAAVFNATPRVALAVALEDLRKWIDRANFVWAHPPSFDLRLLRQAYERCNLRFPIARRAELCYRTLWRLLELKLDGEKIKVPARQGIAHCAVDDAVWQATCAVEAMRRLQVVP